MPRQRFRLPTPPAPAPSQEAFVLMSPENLPALTPEEEARRQALYQWAYNEAQAVVRPSILERDLLGVWN
jgi:hypothetical protein